MQIRVSAQRLMRWGAAVLAVIAAAAAVGCTSDVVTSGSTPPPSISESSTVPTQDGAPTDDPTSSVAVADTKPRAEDASPDLDPEVELQKARISRVVDGDTAWVTFSGSGKSEKVRFIGVDTPENTIEVEPYGAEASKYAKKHLTAETVFLETDAEKRDRYGRLLAYVWMSKPRAADSDGRPTLAEAKKRMFNAWLVRDGYAQTLTIPPNVRYEDYLLDLQRDARDADRGLWDPALVAASRQKSEKSASGNFIGNRRSKKFHLATCRWVDAMNESNKVPFKKRGKAVKAGYVPCKVCRP